MERELVEIIAYAISAYKKSIPVGDIFTITPTDANGYLAEYVVKAIEQHSQKICVDAERYQFLRSGVGMDHMGHTQACIDVMIWDWGKNLGREGVNRGVWSALSLTEEDLDKAVDEQRLKRV